MDSAEQLHSAYSAGEVSFLENVIIHHLESIIRMCPPRNATPLEAEIGGHYLRSVDNRDT